MKLKLQTFFLMLALLVSGCAHFPRNASLVSTDQRTSYSFQNTASPTNSSDLLLMLAFSGGGTRAAALWYGVLEELARTPVGAEGKQHRLLDEVDSIPVYTLLWHNLPAHTQRKEAIFVRAKSSGRNETDDFANHKYL